MKPRAPMLDKVKFKCFLCGAPMGGCDCWTPCKCGWTYEKGTECRNPKCSAKTSAGEQPK